MKRFVLALLTPLFTATAVVNAVPVSAPKVPRETIYAIPNKTTLTIYTPTSETTIDTARQQVISQAEHDGHCPEWAGLAYDIGWPPEQIPKLLRIIHRESRCLPDACSTPDRPDIRRCRDWGLTQINDYSWKRTIQSQGMVMTDMWNPELNLRFALWLYQYSEDRNGDGWQPWQIQPN